jgi:hypothetical protein
MPRSAKTTGETRVRRGNPPVRHLDRLIEEAPVDAYTESEQITAFFTMIDENLVTPFTAQVLGVDVVVTRIELTDDEEVVAVFRRGSTAQRIPILDLPLPAPAPDGVEWIHAVRHWARPRSSRRH